LHSLFIIYRKCFDQALGNRVEYEMVVGCAESPRVLKLEGFGTPSLNEGYFLLIGKLSRQNRTGQNERQSATGKMDKPKKNFIHLPE
jgi:hypothetical protein